MIIAITLFLLLLNLIKKTWIEWKTYHTTILYISVCNVFQNMVSGDYLLWKFNPLGFPSHEHADIFMSFVSLPLLALLYLTNFFRKTLFKEKIRTMLFWTITSIIIQYIAYKWHFVTYHHGYKFWMEILFYIAMYSFLPLHHRRPVLTYLLTVLVAMFFIFYFDVPIGH